MKIDKQIVRRRVALGRRAGRQLISAPRSVTTIGSLVQRQTTWDLSEPWWNKRAIRYLSRHVRPGGRVFEWGSGGSTVWLAHRGAAATSIEHDAEWVQKVAERCPDADIRLIPGMTSGHLRSEPELRDKGQHFFDDYVAAIGDFDDEIVDIVIVDGLCRLECVRRAKPKVKPGGLLIVDDSDFRCLSPIKKELSGWRAVKLGGFKPPFEATETTFFHKPG